MANIHVLDGPLNSYRHGISLELEIHLLATLGPQLANSSRGDGLCLSSCTALEKCWLRWPKGCSRDLKRASLRASKLTWFYPLSVWLKWFAQSIGSRSVKKQDKNIDGIYFHHFSSIKRFCRIVLKPTRQSEEPDRLDELRALVGAEQQKPCGSWLSKFKRMSAP